jgi:hypothetical protein
MVPLVRLPEEWTAETGDAAIVARFSEMVITGFFKENNSPGVQNVETSAELAISVP